MKRKLQSISAFGTAILSFFLAKMPAFAQIKGTPSSSSVQSAAQQIITMLNGFGLAYIQAAVSIGIAILVIVGVVKASRAKNTTLLWTEIAFGLVGIILVLNPLLIINAMLKVGTWFGGN